MNLIDIFIEKPVYPTAEACGFYCFSQTPNKMIS